MNQEFCPTHELTNTKKPNTIEQEYYVLKKNDWILIEVRDIGPFI